MAAWLFSALSYFDEPAQSSERRGEYWEDEEFWAAFEVDDDYVPRVPWYRRTAQVLAAFVIAGLIATGALVPWGELVDRFDNVSDPIELRTLADEYVAESPYGWLVSDVRVRNIPDSTTGAFVISNPPDGIITIDLIGWDPDDLQSTVAHEIGHLLDFAAYGDAAERRDGLGSEAWAECAAVDAGFRRTDGSIGDSPYHCTDSELERYRVSVGALGEVCTTWGAPECRMVDVIGG